MSLPIRINPHVFNPKLFYQLPEKQQQRVSLWVGLMEQIMSDDHPLRRMEQEASRFKDVRGFSLKTFRRFYDEIRKGADWRVFVHGCAMDKKKKERKGLPPAFVKYWQEECLSHQRGKVAAVHRKLVRDWQAGKSIPGFGTWREWWREEKGTPPPDSPNYKPALPPSLSYQNLIKKKPDVATRELAYHGPKKFSQLLPGVIKTRAGLEVGQVTMWDDMWFNSECYYGEQIVRALGLAGIDVASTYCHTFGMQPRVRDEITGKRTHLKEKDMRYLVAAQLQGTGFHPEGNIQMVELGTAAVNEDLEKAMFDCTGGIVRVKRASKVGGAFYDQFRGAFGGQTKHKALIEVLHNYIQNEAGFLPGQVGKNHDDCPEEREGLNHYALTLLKTAAEMPEHLRQHLLLPHPTWANFCQAIYEVMDRVADRTDHNIEGFAANGWTGTEYRLGERSPWVGPEIFNGLTGQELAAVQAVVRQEGNSQPVKLSPRQVWQRGADKLVRLGPWHSPALLGRDAIRELRVKKNHTFTLKEKSVDAEPIVFPAFIINMEERMEKLTSGETYGLYFNPYLPQWATVVNAKGQVLGVTKRQERVAYGDQEGFEAGCKEAAKQFAVAAAPYKALQEKKARQRKAEIKNNTALINQAKAEGKAMVERSEAEEDAAANTLDYLNS